MLKPKSSWFIYRFFSWYINQLIQKNFHQYIFNQPDIHLDKAILLLANHFSWWDGFLLFQLNRVFLKKRFYILVNSSNYKKVWFFKYLGAFAAEHNNVAETIQYAGKLLNNPENVVVVFPQGKLHSTYINSFVFKKGIAHIAQASTLRFQYLFVAFFVDYFQQQKPTVTTYLKVHGATEFIGLNEVNAAYKVHYQTSRQQQAQKTV